MILEVSAGGVQFQGEEYVCRLEHLRYLVIDEADRMVEQGHFQELSSILELIHRKRYIPHLHLHICNGLQFPSELEFLSGFSF